MEPDPEELRRKRLSRLLGTGPGTGEPDKPAEKPSPSPPVKAPGPPPALPTPLPPPSSQDMEVDESQSQPCLKGGASQVSLDFDSGIENMELEEGRATDGSNGSPTKRNRTTSSANYESTPEQMLGSLQSILGVSLPGAEGGVVSGSLACPQATALAPQLAEQADLVSLVLAEVVAGMEVQEAVQYLANCYSRHRVEESSCGKRAMVPPLSTLLTTTKHQLVTSLALTLRSQVDPPINKSPLYCVLADEKLPFDLVVSLVTVLNEDSEAFATVFSPLLQNCLVEACRSRQLTSTQYLAPLRTLTSLVKLRLPNGSRPIADLLGSQPQWNPAPISPATGLEIVGLSYLGPFLSPSVFPDEDPAVAEEYFKDCTSGTQQQQVKTAQSALQPNLELLRTQLHQLFHEALANKASRGPLLDWLQAAIARNAKRTQLQANERLVAGDGFMLNLTSVLQKLCFKVKQDKVDAGYLHKPGSRLDITDESRLKASKQEVDEFVEKQKKGEEPNFPTECWFLTLQAHHVGVLPIIRRYQRRLRALRELAKMVEDLEKSEPDWRNHPSAAHNRNMLKKWKKQIKQQSKSKACADIGLLDEQLFSRCLSFYSSCADHMLRLLDPVQPNMPNLPLPQEPPLLFKLLPEWVVDDMADFLLFGLQFLPQVVSTYCSSTMVTWLQTMLCHTHYFANPYLASKLVEVLFVVNPQVQEKTGELYASIMSHPVCQEFLPSALMRFYTEVEQTGSSNEFYDKFTIRYHISIIMKSMWESGVHKMAIVIESNNGKNFIKFINMMMNDTTFLLDESLDALKRIHEVQEDMADPAKWAAQTQEQQTSRARQLGQDERQCRSYLTLARETVDMFHYLTEGIKEPFLRPELADRLAAMLDAVLDQLTNGPKCKNLKVKHPEKYSWDPKWLLSHLIDIYLHLDTGESREKLIRAIANDQRAFKLSTFQDTARRMESSLGRSAADVAQFAALGEAANNLVDERRKQEVEWDNVPTEFECAIMGELMEDPVVLPSGNRCDRKNIERHILSTPNDPFNRQPLTEDMLRPDLELKQQIETWKTAQARAASGSSTSN